MECEKNEFPVLETERLVLRKIGDEDIKTLYQYWSDSEVTRYMNIEPFEDPFQAKTMIDLLNHLFEKGEAIRWGIVEKETGCLIGTCGYNSGYRIGASAVEIGYDLGREYWGKGFMAEALKSIIDHGFNEAGMKRIEAYVMPDNIRSRNLLIKLGFKYEGKLKNHGFYKGEYQDEYIFSLTK